MVGDTQRNSPYNFNVVEPLFLARTPYSPAPSVGYGSPSNGLLHPLRGDSGASLAARGFLHRPASLASGRGLPKRRHTPCKSLWSQGNQSAVPPVLTSIRRSEAFRSFPPAELG